MISLRAGCMPLCHHQTLTSGRTPSSPAHRVCARVHSQRPLRSNSQTMRSVSEHGNNDQAARHGQAVQPCNQQGPTAGNVTCHEYQISAQIQSATTAAATAGRMPPSVNPWHDVRVSRKRKQRHAILRGEHIPTRQQLEKRRQKQVCTKNRSSKGHNSRSCSCGSRWKHWPALAPQSRPTLSARLSAGRSTLP